MYYGAKGVAHRYERVEGNSSRSVTLTELRKYTEYAVQVLAYTRVGDGAPSTPPVRERTYEDVPGERSHRC